MILDLHLPTAVVFGRNRLAELGAQTKRHGGHALLVTGRTAMRANGALEAAVTSLEGAGVRVTIADTISPDPLASEVDAAAASARAAGCDVVVGLGGGSAIDAAKAVSVGLRHGPVGPLVGSTLPATGDLTPVVAVPTTGGSGAEVTKGAIITDDRRALKSGIRGDDLFPRVALIDPDLLLSVPAPVASAAAFDALAHAVEGSVARRASPITRGLAAQALEILGRRLPEVRGGTSDPGLREDLALAALLGGINVANASTCLPHRLQQAMGSVPRVRVSHGDGLAAVYPAWLRLAVPHAEAEFADIARLLGGSDPHERIAAVYDALGVQAGLIPHGLRAMDVDTLVEAVAGNTDNDPVPDIGRDTIRAVYEGSL
ncbi:iron-containing alcohol dehydrogenase [Streptomyces sp. NPDC050287]|uniref:iron-containing alcohol dehydrogenase n=1 Tax=Streptomyces sp. NPDC050287 TaxID=3365608 RepID=UPI0037AF00FD